ncbi:MAG: hypothetical protein DRI44_07615 [Chlamydiae bacterium]|nr:MAG: hypothetical protein DRI44_07615 [Chlamydiota bacterium]
MKNIKIYILFIPLFLFGVHTKMYASGIKDSQLAQLSTNVQNCYSADFLINSAIEAGKAGGDKSVDVIAEILKKCNELDYVSTIRHTGNQTDIARAYAMFYLAKSSKKIPRAVGIIEDNFKLKRPICMALSKAKYHNLYKLMNKEISRLFSKYPSTINDKTLANEISKIHPGIKFILENRIGAKDEIVNDELLQAMLDFALSMETIRLSKYMSLCRTVLKHNGSYLWDKPVIRAVMKNKTSGFNKYELIKKELKLTRNTENDKCEWDFNKPETVLFSIKNISYEAYLILSLWRLNIDLNKKMSETLPSLNSSSFTAEAAAVDCLASNKKTIPQLKKVLESNDDKLKYFLALRIAEETNAPAMNLLKKLKRVKAGK